MGVSINGGIPKMMVYSGKSCWLNIYQEVSIYIYISKSISKSISIYIYTSRGGFSCASLPGLKQPFYQFRYLSFEAFQLVMGGTPIAGWFIRENSLQMDALEVPPFQETPIYIYIYTYILLYREIWSYVCVCVYVYMILCICMLIYLWYYIYRMIFWWIFYISSSSLKRISPIFWMVSLQLSKPDDCYGQTLTLLEFFFS